MESKIVIPKKVKLLATTMIILAILTVGIPLCLFAYYKYNIYVFKKETYDYLYGKGYEEHEIKKVEIVIEIGSLLSSVVEFADEPNVLYWYDKRDGEIVQIGIYGSNDGVTESRHSE